MMRELKFIPFFFFCNTSDTIELVVSSIEVHAYVGGDAHLVCIAHTPSNTSLKIEWFSNNIRLSSQDGYIKEHDFVFKNRRYLMSVYDTCSCSSRLSLGDNSIFECRASEKSDYFMYHGSNATINLVVFGKYVTDWHNNISFQS